MPYVPGIGWVYTAYDEKPAEQTSYAGANTTVNTTTLAGIAAASAAPYSYGSFRQAEQRSMGDTTVPVVTGSSSAAVDKAAEDAAAKAAKAEADRIAAELAAANAKTKAELDAANAAKAKAELDAAAARTALATQQAQQNSLTQQLLAQQKASQEAATLAAEKQRQSIVTILQDRFAQYGLSGLGAKIKELAIDGATEATITLGLQATDEYKQRFKANEARIKNGLAVLQPAQYLNLEDGYRQVLRSYGLTAFDNDDYVQQFIANDVSAAELSNRVVTAVQRVQNADPAVAKQLKDYYGIGAGDMVAYVLDPQQQFQKIQRQVAAAEIGVAAAKQGLSAGVGVAEQLAAQGVTQAEAQKGYSTIADILPTAEKLSAIYGETTAKYGQSEAEQEVFNSLASAQRARQKLTALEVAQFGGQSGMSKTSLTSPTSGAF